MIEWIPSHQVDIVITFSKVLFFFCENNYNFFDEQMKLKCELMLVEVHTWACLKNCLCFSCIQASAKVIKYDALEIEVNAVVISNYTVV